MDFLRDTLDFLELIEISEIKFMRFQAKKFARMGKSGESDRHIATKMPKHLFAGKRGFKADRR